MQFNKKKRSHETNTCICQPSLHLDTKSKRNEKYNEQTGLENKQCRCNLLNSRTSKHGKNNRSFYISAFKINMTHNQVVRNPDSFFNFRGRVFLPPLLLLTSKGTCNYLI